MRFWNQNAKFSLEVDHKHILEATYLGVYFTNVLTVQNFEVLSDELQICSRYGIL